MGPDNVMNDWIRRVAGRLPAEPESTDTEQEQSPTDDAAKPTTADERLDRWIRRQLVR